MAFPYYDLVQQAHAELIASGQIARRDNAEAVEHDKGLQTRRAGYYANLQDPSIGILEKTTGNNALGYSVDILIDRGGRFWDVATDSNGLAMPIDGETRGPDPDLASKWRQPTAALAGLTDVPVPIPPTPTPPAGWIPVIPFDDSKAVQFGLSCNDTYTESGATVDPGMISVHSARCAWDYYVGQMPWDACLAKHIDEFRAEYGLPPLS